MEADRILVFLATLNSRSAHASIRCFHQIVDDRILLSRQTKAIYQCMTVLTASQSGFYFKRIKAAQCTSPSALDKKIGHESFHVTFVRYAA
jgi:hypothetical protein